MKSQNLKSCSRKLGDFQKHKVIKTDERIGSVIADVKLLGAAEDVTVTCIKTLRQLLEWDNTNEL